MNPEIMPFDCVTFLSEYQGKEFDLSFLDPPFNQNKDYDYHDDNIPMKEYWFWMALVHKSKSRHNPFDGREKLCHFVTLGHPQMCHFVESSTAN